MMDWTGCPDVESIPGKVSGVPVLKDSRVPADAVIENAQDGYTPEEIASEIFEGLPVERVRRVIAFALDHANPA